uniref:BAI1 associated protein 3 n=1 Tax=Sphaeramia orbicularis TaxID=375764 RepID=A0A672Y9H9_9TELE
MGNVYFKQIAKSVRSNGSASSGSEENADDFLGCINISLSEIPVTGYDTWFKLEPRSSASKVQGECHLILKLFTSQRDTTLSKKDSNVSIHKKLLSQIVEYDFHHLETVTSLAQLFTDIHEGFWLSQKCLAASVLEAITAGPSCVQERQLSDSFRLYTEHCLCLMKNMRQVFPCTSAALKCINCVICCCAHVLCCKQIDPVQEAKHSSSAVEVTTCFSQVREIWLQLAWPDSAGAFIFITRLTDVSATSNINIPASFPPLFLHLHPVSPLLLLLAFCQLCIALNNMERVRVFLSHLPRDLDWTGVERAMEESCGLEGKEQVYKALNGQLFNMDLDLQREAKRLITVLTDKVPDREHVYIQHISLSPDSINNDEAVSPLMKYLQDTMNILTETLVKENLTRVLQSMWELLLRMILDSVTENRGVQVEFYNRFQYTVEPFTVTLAKSSTNCTFSLPILVLFQVLDEELKLNKCSSFELIEQYYLEKISHQKTLKHTRYGRISVKCYYDAPEQRLTVEILHAADIIALDANGLSDPFVIVELCPHHLFPMAKSQRTQVKLKTLHPVFDELFYFHVSPEQYRHRYACLTFTVMDYDWLSTNDFAGEAVAPLSDFCWPGRPNASAAGKSVQPSILHLSRKKPIMRMLDARIGDREAQEFVRRLKEIEKSMEEE